MDLAILGAGSDASGLAADAGNGWTWQSAFRLVGLQTRAA